MAKALKGVENVYTQHTPLVSETLSLLASNDLPSNSYPYASEAGVSFGSRAKLLVESEGCGTLDARPCPGHSDGAQ